MISFRLQLPLFHVRVDDRHLPVLHKVGPQVDEGATDIFVQLVILVHGMATERTAEQVEQIHAVRNTWGNQSIL